MTTSQANHDQLRMAADEVGGRVTQDPASVGESADQIVHTLQALGVPGETIAELLRAEGMEEADVAGYNFAPTPPDPTGPVPLIVNTFCIGTCMSITLVITWRRRRQS